MLNMQETFMTHNEVVHSRLTGGPQEGRVFPTTTTLFGAADSEEGVWPLGSETWFVLAAQDPVGEGELDLGILGDERGGEGRERERDKSVRIGWWQQWREREGAGPDDTYVELLDGGSAALIGSDHLHLHDLDGVGAGTVAGTHVTVCGRERSGRGRY